MTNASRVVTSPLGPWSAKLCLRSVKTSKVTNKSQIKQNGWHDVMLGRTSAGNGCGPNGCPKTATPNVTQVIIVSRLGARKIYSSLSSSKASEESLTKAKSTNKMGRMTRRLGTNIDVSLCCGSNGCLKAVANATRAITLPLGAWSANLCRKKLAKSLTKAKSREMRCGVSQDVMLENKHGCEPLLWTHNGCPRALASVTRAIALPYGAFSSNSHHSSSPSKLAKSLTREPN